MRERFVNRSCPSRNLPSRSPRCPPAHELRAFPPRQPRGYAATRLRPVRTPGGIGLGRACGGEAGGFGPVSRSPHRPPYQGGQRSGGLWSFPDVIIPAVNWDQDDLKKRGLISTGFHLPYNPHLVELARSMRKSPTPAEEKLWHHYLKHCGYRVLRQRPIDNFIVDFYCPKKKLVLEIDGATHFTAEGKGSDKERTAILESYGLQVVRFSDHDVISKFPEVRKKIGSFLSMK